MKKLCTKRILCSDISKHVGDKVCLQGWVHKVRKLGGVSFVLLRDRSETVQIVCNNGNVPKQESVVQVEALVTENKKAPTGVELHNPTFVELSVPQEDPPLQTNVLNIGIDVLLNNRVMSLRIPEVRSVFEIQNCIIECFSSFLRSHDFTEIKTSKLIGSGTEGGTGLFTVKYFDTEVFLAQSPQFYKQAAMSSGLERVFEIGPVYRAEKHETNRHINEYVSLDVEMAFIEDIQTLCDLQIGFLQLLSEILHTRYNRQLKLLDCELPLPENFTHIPFLDYSDAKKVVQEISGARVLDIDPRAEKTICEWAKTQYNIPAVFITGFPRRKRPFYTMPDGQKTKGFDLLYGGLEVSTGGLRINNYNDLCESIESFGLQSTHLTDYLNIFRYACPPHGGFAIGLERLTQKFLGLSNVRLASMFPRDRSRITP